ncbi:putative DNA-binding pseudobarrel domain superfamily [Helianthus annuus]|nr:putative DNA-binding pseudobarrel domain superfamily [Helianthus annuus]
MSGPFVKKKLILRFDGRRSWALSFEKPYNHFLLMAFNVDFDVLCKKTSRLSNVCLVDDPFDKNRSFCYIILDRSCSRVFSPSEIIRDHLGLSCCNVDCKFLVDEEYAQNIKIERSGNKFFFSRDWVKVVQQIKMKFATFVLFQYMGQRKYKLIVFMNDSTQLIVSHPQANPKAAHDTVIILF